MRAWSYLVLAFAFTSCATITNKSSHNLTITTNSPGDRMVFQDSIYAFPATLSVTRSKSDLHFSIVNDSGVKKDMTIKSVWDPRFFVGNFIFGFGYPVGFLVDLTNPKRFYYGTRYRINDSDSAQILRAPFQSYVHRRIYKQLDNPTRGRLNVLLSMPYANAFNFHPPGQSRKSREGFFGIAAGLEYFRDKTHSTRLTVGFAGDFPEPVPVPLDRGYGSDVESFSSQFISLTRRTRINRLIVGYGINYSMNRVTFEHSPRRDSVSVGQDSVYFRQRHTNQTLGLTGSIHWQFSPAWSVGVVYNPTFVVIRPKIKLDYQHLIGLEFLFKIRISKPR